MSFAFTLCEMAFRIPTQNDVPSTGFWGAATAVHQFCEPKYKTSHYVAEFYNSLSSFVYVFAAVYVLSRREARADPMIVINALAVTIIGLGSVAFHGTMLFEFELCDEVPMLVYISLAMLNKLGCHPMLLTRARCVVFASLVISACALTIAVYAKYAVYEFFVASFTALVLLDTALALTWRSKQRVTTWAVYMSMACILLGKILWECEVRLCSTDGRVWPLHVVWHALSCAAAYYGLLADMAARIDCGLSPAVAGGETKVALRWAAVPFSEVHVVCAAEEEGSKAR